MPDKEKPPDKGVGFSDLLDDAKGDRAKRPWRYYKLSRERLELLLDRYADRFGSI